ncbi:MAG TPA: peptidase MA family metallohydrolase [Candidatus Limnocylindria bacterium]|nr:peptidase MA family metallohydrolase [Candidatus Limnocylindria bacterium]
MTRLRRAACGLTLLLVVAAAALPAAVFAASPAFGTPTVSAELNEPITLSSEISADDIAAVEVLVRLVGDPTTVVLPAQPGQAGTWDATHELDIPRSSACECLFEGNSAPNTHFEFQFRVRATDGTLTVGPLGQGVVEDARFNWRILEQGLVRVHWYAGDDAFARGAADYANQAIDRASELLGATLPATVDLFVYDTQQELLDAVSPNRESIAGEAHREIQTMFAWLPHDQDIDGFNGEVVRHELTHLVFDEATHNPYHDPPTWLNEGTAVYLSVGYSDYYRSFVDGAVATDSLIPLDGLTGIFPPGDDFYLAYGEAVSAVDFFVSTYTEQKLWDLLRSYQQGMTDDAAFTAAIGRDAAAFNAAWFESLGSSVPEPLGPQPAPPGPVPPDWAPGGATPGPTLAPGQTPPTPRPAGTPRPGQESPGAVDGVMRVVTLTLWVIVIALVIGVFGFILYQRRVRRG